MKKPSGRAPRPSPAGATGDACWAGAHTTHRLRFHLVWCPKHQNAKYRRRVLEGPLAARLRALLEEACGVSRWRLREINVQPDHVHLLVQIPPSRGLASVVGRLKGGTSRVIREESPDLRESLWGGHLWSDGYFAETQ